MDHRSRLRTAPRRAVGRPVETGDEPGLRALSRSTARLIAALASGAPEPALRESVAAYVGCAAEQGISSERIDGALELLVHEHAVPDQDLASHARASRHRPGPGPARLRHQATAHVLELVLRLASDARTGAVRPLPKAV